MSSFDSESSELQSKEFLTLQIKKLEQRLLDLEEERRELYAERERLLREIEFLREELEKLSTPPLVEAYVIDVLQDGRVVVKSSTGPNLVVTVSERVDKKKLLPGTRVALNQRTFSVMEVLPETFDSYIRAMEVIDAPEVTYNDIGGLKQQIEELRELIELPLTKPDLFKKVGIEPPKGVLLYGPPGCGKTLLAKAVARESKATFIKVVGSELVQKYIGEGARLVRELFALARKKAPSIVFIDEIDAIGGKRYDFSTSGEKEVYRTMMQLLSELDGFSSRGDVKVIGATNRIDMLDPALLRPGRFDRLIEVPLPDFNGRLDIFRIHIKSMNLHEDVDIKALAKITEGASGADIKAICTEAGMFAIRNGREYVQMEDFMKAIEKILKKDRGKGTTTYI
ncbi:MAG: proteasome-activating nucleotidase [Candidatus Methanomethylicota archaeon]|uniref:Proteasome-activating nucleotidase n=1 Tax=Thermoproteota archaeon TaxID=2056631 RepID=A0A497ET60_9CREN|nr:MAG: proteasome-activating nucleotidase [Candidatus Verstraetearchaeota archaeon]RLE50708.1 MAG: proteasome-activating nucleotidase [Candidatus Verstraetearchaeota archaeon]